MPRCSRRLALIWMCTCPLLAEEYPRATITNGLLTARLMLPDAQKGSYRGTRFDGSGIVASLTYLRHEYFGQWYAKHDPLVNDAITGPVNVFHGGTAGLGYDEAQPGETFLRIGVGEIEKVEEKAFQETRTYRVVRNGWRIQQGETWIEFTQRLASSHGYGFEYVKRITLTPGKPEMVLSHVLRNTGVKAIDTVVYNHGFFQIDREPAGPGLLWTFAFEPRAPGDLGGMAEIRGRQIHYLREMVDGERLLTVVEGYGQAAASHDFRVANRKTGAAIHFTGDRPIAKLNFWSRRWAYSPEAYVRLQAAPGQAERWRLTYEFQAGPGAGGGQTK